MASSEESLKGRHALVTGGGSGIGAATARHLAARGAKVAVLGRTEDELVEVCESLRGGADEHLALVADVSDEAAMQAAYERVRNAWGKLDIVVANAGINGVWTGLDELATEEWEKTLRINLTGTFLTAKLALPLLRPHGGSIVIVSSVNGTRMFSNTGATAYACSKAAQATFAKMIAVELGPEKIRVNVVCPGAIETSIDENTERRDLDDIRMPVEFPKGEIPLTCGTPGTPDQVARLIGFLGSDDASHISGSQIFIDGAQSLLQG